MQSLAVIGNGRAHAIFEGRTNPSRHLTLLDLLEMGIHADVVKALVDDLEINAIPCHEIEVQQMVVAALASLQRIDDVNRRPLHFESVLRAGWTIAGPIVECG